MSYVLCLVIECRTYQASRWTFKSPEQLWPRSTVIVYCFTSIGLRLYLQLKFYSLMTTISEGYAVCFLRMIYLHSVVCVSEMFGTDIEFKTRGISRDQMAFSQRNSNHDCFSLESFVFSNGIALIFYSARSPSPGRRLQCFGGTFEARQNHRLWMAVWWIRLISAPVYRGI